VAHEGGADGPLTALPAREGPPPPRGRATLARRRRRAKAAAAERPREGESPWGVGGWKVWPCGISSAEEAGAEKEGWEERIRDCRTPRSTNRESSSSSSHGSAAVPTAAWVPFRDCRVGGYVLAGEKKIAPNGRNIAESVVSPCGSFPQPGSTKKFLICGPFVRGWR